MFYVCAYAYIELVFNRAMSILLLFFVGCPAFLVVHAWGSCFRARVSGGSCVNAQEHVGEFEGTSGL